MFLHSPPVERIQKDVSRIEKGKKLDYAIISMKISNDSLEMIAIDGSYGPEWMKRQLPNQWLYTSYEGMN